MKRTGIPLHVLRERLGEGSRGFAPDGPRRYKHHLIWQCTHPPEDRNWCFAYSEGDYRPVPHDLTPFEAELFDHAPAPENDWTLRACSKHDEMFADYPEEED